MIFVIDENKMMAECIAKACGKNEVKVFGDAITAMESLSDSLPDLIFMDVMLNGPDCFTFLNELISYSDTMKIPIVITTTLELEEQDMSAYGVVGILQKETMKPDEVRAYVEKYC